MAVTDFALQVHDLSKSFRVARGGGDSSDPRRERLSWRYDRFRALRGVSFSVGRGQTLGLIGPNGSGKSTLLKILSGVMAPESGRFTACGRVGALLELGAGFHPDLSGVENVYLSGALLGLPAREINRLLPGIIAFAELERFMDMPVRHYSSGMVGRLGFAVATQLRPEILLMDETFATGDARFQGKALDHVARLKSLGHTMILASHNWEMLLLLADHVIWLDHGTLRREGPPREVLAEYRRTVRVGDRVADRLRGSLGLDSLFDAVDPERNQIRIESARLAVEDGEPAAAPGNLVTSESQPGAAVPQPNNSTKCSQECGTAECGTAECGTAECGTSECGTAAPGCDSFAPEILEIQTGRRVRLELELAHPGAHPEEIFVETAWARNDERTLAQSRTRVRLAAGASSRLVLVFGPWELTQALWRPAVALSPAPPDPALPFRYYDRRLNLGAVRVLTPNPFEIPALTPFKTRWEV